MHTNKRNFGLDLVRAIAIVAVLISHGRYFFTDLFPGVGKIYAFGYVGVEIFFVLSGFLIGGILYKSLESRAHNEVDISNLSRLKNFWVRRWFRTLPNYYLFLVVYLILFAVTQFAYPILGSLKYLFFTQTFLDPQRPYPFSVSWSLAVEEWFYLLFPLIPFLFHEPQSSKRKEILWTANILLFLTVPLLLRIYFAVWEDANWGPAIRNSTLLRLDAIAYGAIGATLVAKKVKFWEYSRLYLFVIGVLSLLINIVYLQSIGEGRDISLYCRTFQFSVVSLSVLMTLPLVSQLQINKGILRSSITKVSEWSYSMYLIHMLILEVLFYVKDRAGRSPIELVSNISAWPMISLAYWAIFMVTTVVASKFVFERFELPLTRCRDKFSTKEKKMSFDVSR